MPCPKKRYSHCFVFRGVVYQFQVVHQAQIQVQFVMWHTCLVNKVVKTVRRF